MLILKLTKYLTLSLYKKYFPINKIFLNLISLVRSFTAEFYFYLGTNDNSGIKDESPPKRMCLRQEVS